MDRIHSVWRNDKLGPVRSILKKPIVIWGITISFYWVSLFPARLGADTNSLILLMESGESTAHWTALYFRLFQLLTLNGNAIWLGSLICLLLLATSIENLLRAVSKDEKTLFRLRNVIACSPFFGVFGMTLDHQLLTTIGFLNLITYFFGNKEEFIPKIMKKTKWIPKVWLLISTIALQTTFQGIVISCVFAFALIGLRKGLYFAFSVLIFSTFSASILQVSTIQTEVSASVADLRLVPLLGDLKCVTQHPKVNLSSSDIETLTKIGEIEKWQDPKPCILADYAFFALDGSSRYQREILETWLNLATQYPQLILVAHLQRSAMALPPPFFSGQPNMIPKNSLEPVGTQLSVELQQWSELFKTSIDNENLKNNRPKLMQLLEPFPLLIAFFFNQNSEFWGWGGLWMFLAATILVLRRKEGSSLLEARSLIPLLALSIFLFLVSPAASPRYVMPQILFGVILSTEYLFRKLAFDAGKS